MSWGTRYPCSAPAGFGPWLPPLGIPRWVSKRLIDAAGNEYSSEPSKVVRLRDAGRDLEPIQERRELPPLAHV
jgi:hypothetical protein